MKIPSSFTHPQVQGPHVPRTFRNRWFCPPLFFYPRQYLRPRSLICYLDLSELKFSQSQGESSLGRVFELHICHYSCGFIHLLLCSLADWGKMHPIKKSRGRLCPLFSPQTHIISMCYVAMTRFTHVMIEPTVMPHQGSTVRAFATKNYDQYEPGQYLDGRPPEKN